MGHLRKAKGNLRWGPSPVSVDIPVPGSRIGKWVVGDQGTQRGSKFPVPASRIPRNIAREHAKAQKT